MAAEIEKALPATDVVLKKGGRGDFIVIADGQTLWNKKEQGSFPEEAAIVARLRTLAG